VVEEDLEEKHKLMAKGAFEFLRATYYRWTARWPERCAKLTDAPSVLAVGDLHTENFGTWRDADGRLVWGVNDFDEAYPLPYTSDLVRLATSALLAIKRGRLAIRRGDACDAILLGYEQGLAKGGRPFVFAERHAWLGEIGRRETRDAREFWAEIEALPVARDGAPANARAALESTLPYRHAPYTVLRRVAGVGSLGCPRFVALADWQGGKIAREGKAMPPSAHVWGGDVEEPGRTHPERIVDHSMAARDPFLRFSDGWRIRRLAPDCCKLDLGDLPGQRDEERLLRAMGKETANIHLGSPEAIPAIRSHLKSLRKEWLLTAARTMAETVREEWKEWRSFQKAR
jgi:hypothetical protein